MATQALRIIALGFPLYAFGMVMSQSFTERATPDPDRDQPVRVLAVRDSTSHTCWPTTALSYRGGIRGRDGGVLRAGPRQRMAIPSRQVEDEAGLRMWREGRKPPWGQARWCRIRV